MLAGYLAQKTGARDDTNMVQRNKVYHTGADAMQRLIAPSEFAGTVEVGARYVLVDDVSAMDGTSADLADYVLANGGQVGKKPNTSSVSVPLTNSEIERLQRNKRALSDYARKVFGPKK